MFDAYKHYSEKAKNGHFGFVDLWGNQTTIPDAYYYLTCHREENSNAATIREVLQAMETLDYQTVYPVHPRMRELVLDAQRELALKNTIFIEPVGYLESLFLLNGSLQVITDSGGLQRESFFAEKKCVTLLPFSATNEILLGNRNTILEKVTQGAILTAMGQPQSVDPEYMPFGTGNAAQEIVDAIEGFFK